jgi:hypothetical protein
MNGKRRAGGQSRKGSPASRAAGGNGQQQPVAGGFDQFDKKRIKAVGHPMRWRILGALAEHETMSPKQLSDYLEEDLNLVAYHVKTVLCEECQLLEMVEEAPRRGAVEHFYRIKPEAMSGNPDWQTRLPSLLIGDIKSAALKSFLEKACQAAAAFDSKRSHTDDVLAWVPARVSPNGRREIAEVLNDALERVRKIAARDNAQPTNETAVSLVVGISSFETGERAR